ncbi:hypothetical protein HYH02_004116 [Chlamydomonas schloesseri]|uniref:EF-hand domain-containing protein n=1 Tax=Chlamydomonas schloesseri TaxID=2026947 RepID=A0A835WQJ7_9CHLO|nr:hypothetical protein HYH02_004116 [Chlamydomonas schloesseri]|eukprot:KAG2451518.1 hypothetical protein HYH02_004116 [Chlamydomonas schloesseri]
MLSQPGTPTRRTPRERFSRLAASLDSPSISALMSNAARSPYGAAAQGPAGTGQFATGDAEANMHHSSQAATLPPPSRGGSTANALLPSSYQVAAHMRVKIPLSNLRDSERPGTGMGRTASGTVVQVPLGVPSPSSPQAQAQAFKASRGQTLMVFNEMDSDKNGKVTRSELEAAALSLGFSLEQAHKLWDRLDKRKRGFLEASDWGSRDAVNYIQLFSTRYLQKFMGVPDISSTLEQVRKYQRAQELLEVQSLTAAINKARANAVSRGMQLAGATGNPIYDTFQFMDVDNSGALSKEEIRDAFFALGVFLPEKVVEQIMTTFDQDGSGLVQYHEFQRTMFPSANGRS